MNELLHIIGICPDHFSHLSLFDVFVATDFQISIWYFELKYLILSKFKKYAKKK